MKKHIILPSIILLISSFLFFVYLDSFYMKSGIYGSEEKNAQVIPEIEMPPIVPEIRIQPVALKSPSGNLKMSMIPFVYNSLYQIKDINDSNHAIQVLKEFPYLVCAEPGHLAKKEIEVTEAIKNNVKIFVPYVPFDGL